MLNFEEHLKLNTKTTLGALQFSRIQKVYRLAQNKKDFWMKNCDAVTCMKACYLMVKDFLDDDNRAKIGKIIEEFEE